MEPQDSSVEARLTVQPLTGKNLKVWVSKTDAHLTEKAYVENSKYKNPDGSFMYPPGTGMATLQEEINTFLRSIPNAEIVDVKVTGGRGSALVMILYTEGA
jgi:hypothetical protein